MSESNNNLVMFFNDLQMNKRNITNSSSGNDFEDNLRRTLRSQGFDYVKPDNDKVLREYLDKIKPKVLDVLSFEVLKNELADKGAKYTNIFVHQPYGSQQFPDFIIFTEKNIICMESKYSTKKGVKPVWNSNLPKSNTIYIFGSYGKRDVTFFLGEDILPQNERVILNNFFSETTNKLMKDFQSELKSKFDSKEMLFEHGFNVYIRKAFEQNRVINVEAELDCFGKSRTLNEESVKVHIAKWEEDSNSEVA